MPLWRPQRRDAIDRCLRAYRETPEWMYLDPAAIKAYAEWVNISENLAQEVREQLFPKENLRSTGFPVSTKRWPMRCL